MKTLILKFFVWCLILNSNLDLFSQEIQFNTIFTSDTTLFPFERIDRISSLTVEGEVHLHHETSMVRLIMEDISGYQYMILEAYPLICEDSVMTFYNHCDETCIIGQTQPYK